MKLSSVVALFLLFGWTSPSVGADGSKCSSDKTEGKTFPRRSFLQYLLLRLPSKLKEGETRSLQASPPPTASPTSTPTPPQVQQTCLGPGNVCSDASNCCSGCCGDDMRCGVYIGYYGGDLYSGAWVREPGCYYGNCYGGQCAASSQPLPSSDSCLNAGSTCSSDSDCCFGKCCNGECGLYLWNFNCFDNTIGCADTTQPNFAGSCTPLTCLPSASVCSNAQDCCSGCCGDDNRCGVYIDYYGGDLDNGAWSTNPGCFYGNCYGTGCATSQQQPSSASCFSTGTFCSADSDCCSGNCCKGACGVYLGDVFDFCFDYPDSCIDTSQQPYYVGACPSPTSTSRPTASPTSSPTGTPTSQPTASPTSQPTASPTSQPTTSPTSQPTAFPTSQPTGSPTSQPTGNPTPQPTAMPSASPTGMPTPQPTSPTASPTSKPTSQPTTSPSASPTTAPTSRPTSPTAAPTSKPTSQPTPSPSAAPTGSPTTAPPTAVPTSKPTGKPTSPPTAPPTATPTSKPTTQPTFPPSHAPTAPPTPIPTASPTRRPSLSPTTRPTPLPTAKPTLPPTKIPTTMPTHVPTASPTKHPTIQPTTSPTRGPTHSPTKSPTFQPTPNPTTSDSFCWRDSYDRGVGTIPDQCGSGLDQIGLLCYSQCPEGFSRFGFDCHQNCPGGNWVDTGLFCLLPDYGRGTGYPWQWFETSFDGRLSRCQNAEHTSCEIYLGIAYPVCSSGYFSAGCCLCQPFTPNCKDLKYYGNFGDSCVKYIQLGDPMPMTCSSNLEYNAGLCYQPCRHGYSGAGPVCWGNPPSGWVNCGMGAAVDSSTCASAVFDQVTSVGQIALFVGSLGSAGPEVEAANAAQNAGKLAKLKAQYNTIKQSVEYMKARSAYDAYNEVSSTYDGVDTLVNSENAEDNIRGAATLASIADPTGVAGAVAAYTYATCSALFQPTPSPTPAPTAPPSSNGCFSGVNTVEVAGKGMVAMKDLQLGDKVKDASGKMVTVYTFGHYHPLDTFEFLQVHARNLARPLEISRDHLVYVNGATIPVSAVTVGGRIDVVENKQRTSSKSNSTAVITKIQKVKRIGVYAPFTTSGTIMVSGVAASTYTDLHDGSPVLVVGQYKTPFSKQFLSHVILSPHRLLCSWLGMTFCRKWETYNQDGISNWTEGGFEFVTWLLREGNEVIAAMILVPAFLLAFLMYVMEVGWIYVFAGLAALYYYYMYGSAKKGTKKLGGH